MKPQVSQYSREYYQVTETGLTEPGLQADRLALLHELRDRPRHLLLHELRGRLRHLLHHELRDGIWYVNSLNIHAGLSNQYP